MWNQIEIDTWKRVYWFGIRKNGHCFNICIKYYLMQPKLQSIKLKCTIKKNVHGHHLIILSDLFGWRSYIEPNTYTRYYIEINIGRMVIKIKPTVNSNASPFLCKKTKKTTRNQITENRENLRHLMKNSIFLVECIDLAYNKIVIRLCVSVFVFCFDSSIPFELV